MGKAKRVTGIFLLAAVISLATGCTPLHPTGCHKTTATGGCGSGKWDDQDEWGAQARGIRDAINAQLEDPQRFKHKTCRLHLEFKQDGTVTHISTSNGNKAYCEALRAAAAKAHFPAFSNPEVFRDFEKSGFTMGG